MNNVKIGDYVTGYGKGYWQLIDIKPKIADADYHSENINYKKGDHIGYWAILKKCFTPKMKPRIDFSYEDFSWIKPVSTEILSEIHRYFDDNPKYKEKFENAEIKLQPSIVNCWLDLPEDMESEFKEVLNKLPKRFTKADFIEAVKDYLSYLSKPPCKYCLYLLFYPWDIDENKEIIYSGWDFI